MRLNALSAGAAQQKPPAVDGVSLRKADHQHSMNTAKFGADDDHYVAFGAQADQVNKLNAQYTALFAMKGAKAAEQFHRMVRKPAFNSMAAEAK